MVVQLKTFFLSPNPQFSSILLGPSISVEESDTELAAKHKLSASLPELGITCTDDTEAWKNLDDCDCQEDCATFVLGPAGKGEEGCTHENITVSVALSSSRPLFYPHECMGQLQSQHLRLDSLLFSYQVMVEDKRDKVVIREFYAIKGVETIEQFTANWTRDKGLIFQEEEIWRRRQVCNNTDVNITKFHCVFLEFGECHSNKRDTPVRQLCHC